MGQAAILDGDFETARTYLRESLQLVTRINNTWLQVHSLTCWAILASTERQPERALRLAGAGAALLKRLGIALDPFVLLPLDRALAGARQALGPAAMVAWEAGRALTLEEAVAEVLADEPAG